MMDIRPLRTEADHAWAISEMERYFNDEPQVGTPDGDRFEVLITLATVYEDRHHTIPDADPIAVLRFAIADMGRTQTELAGLLGSKSRASEVLNGKRSLTVDMIRVISDAWHIPIAALVPKCEMACAA